MTRMNRRHVLTAALKTGAAAALVASPFVMPRPAHAATTISFASWGGSWGDFVREFWIKPFTAETGIAVNYVTGTDLAKVKAQVANNNILWDVVDGFAFEGAKEGLWEPIDFKVVDPARFIEKPPAFAVPTNGYVGGFAYDPSRTKNPPKNASQFWDTKNFSGRRGLRNRVSEMLEIALLADGVAAKNLYPLDVERAFRSLDRIKPQVRNWFSETAQGTALIQRNEVDYTYTYLGRVNSAKEMGVSIDFSYDQCIFQMGYFCVVKGSPRKEAAMRFLEFVTRPENQAPMVGYKSKGGFSGVKGVEKFMDPAVRHQGPDVNSPKHVVFNGQYWGEHFIQLDRRFKEWILT